MKGEREREKREETGTLSDLRVNIKLKFICQHCPIYLRSHIFLSAFWGKKPRRARLFFVCSCVGYIECNSDKGREKVLFR